MIIHPPSNRSENSPRLHRHRPRGRFRKGTARNGWKARRSRRAAVRCRAVRSRYRERSTRPSRRELRPAGTARTLQERSDHDRTRRQRRTPHRPGPGARHPHGRPRRTGSRPGRSAFKHRQSRPSGPHRSRAPRCRGRPPLAAACSMQGGSRSAPARKRHRRRQRTHRRRRGRRRGHRRVRPPRREGGAVHAAAQPPVPSLSDRPARRISVNRSGRTSAPAGPPSRGRPSR